MLEDRHNYRGVKLDCPLMSKTERLPADAYRASPATETIKAAEVQTAGQTADWYSPSAQNIPNGTADIFLLRQLYSQEQLHGARNAWVGGVFDHSHRIVFRFKGQQTMFLALSHFSDSAVLAWPCSMEALPTTNIKLLKLSERVEEPTLLAVIDLDEVEAFSFKFVSFMDLYVRFPVARGLLRIGIMMEVVRGPLHVLEIACYEGWWLLSRTVICRFAALKQAQIEAGSSLFATLFSVTKHILNLDDESTLGLVRQRLPAERNASHFSERLLHLDQALEVVDHNDQEEVKATKKAAKTKLEDISAFVSEYKQKRATVMSASGSQPANKKRKRGEASGPAVLPKTIPQSEAKRWIPEGTSVWRSNTRNEWWGHYSSAQYKRIVVPWTLGQEEPAMREVIRRLWAQWLEYRGLPESDCPIQGVF